MDGFKIVCMNYGETCIAEGYVLTGHVGTSLISFNNDIDIEEAENDNPKPSGEFIINCVKCGNSIRYSI